MTEPPHTLRPSRPREWIALAALVAVYLAIFAAFAPAPSPRGPEDAAILRLALDWAAAGEPGVGFAAPGAGGINAPRNAPDPSPLRSAAAAFFIWIGGPDAAPAAGALIHVLTALICAWLIARLGVGPLWFGIVLFNPGLAFASRLTLGDELAGALIATAALALTFAEPGSLRAGICAGLAVAAHPVALAAIPALAVGPAGEAPERRRERLINYGLGAIAALFALGCYHIYAHGTPFGSGLSSMEPMKAGNLDSWIAMTSPAGRVAIAAVLCGSAALTTFLINRSPLRRPMLALCAFFFVATVLCPPPYAGIPADFGSLASIIPILPVLLASFAPGLDRLLRIANQRMDRKPTVCAAIFIGGLIVFMTIKLFDHDLKQRAPIEAARAELVRLIPAGSWVAANPAARNLLEPTNIGTPFRWFALTPKTDPADLAEVVDLERGRWRVVVAPGADRAAWEPALARFEKAFNMRRLIDRPELIVLESPEPTAVANVSLPAPPARG